MARQYGKFARRAGKGTDTPPAAEILIKIAGRHTIEQLTLELQRMISRLQDYDVTGVESFRVRVMPLDHEAKPMLLRDGQGEPVSLINIPDMPPEKPYRDNEPGVGVLSPTHSASPKLAPHPGSTQSPSTKPGR